YGIALGESQDQVGRTYDDDPCGDVLLQHIDGVVTNNIVSAYEDDLIYSNGGVLTGIRVESSCNAEVSHNSVYSAVEPQSSIEQRYDTTTGRMANNLVSHKVVRVADAAAEVLANVEDAQFDSWTFPAGGDFHTSPGAVWAIDQGDPVTIGVVTED